MIPTMPSRHPDFPCTPFGSRAAAMDASPNQDNEAEAPEAAAASVPEFRVNEPLDQVAVAAFVAQFAEPSVALSDVVKAKDPYIKVRCGFCSESMLIPDRRAHEGVNEYVQKFKNLDSTYT